MPGLSHTETHTVRTYDIDQNKKLTLPALIRILQETAMQQVIDLGVSVWDLEPQKIAWVLIRMRLDVKRMPALGEKLTIKTAPTGLERVFTFRDYRLYDAEGQEIVTCATTWLLMNTETRQMARIPAELAARFSHLFPDPDLCLPRAEAAVSTLQAVDHQRSHQVNWFDLDFNGHLNNVFFAKWMLEALPAPTLSQLEACRLDLIFQQEAVLNEHIRAEVQDLGEGQFLLRLVRERDEGVVCLGRLMVSC
jgi:acyl-ACP thioesterase